MSKRMNTLTRLPKMAVDEAGKLIHVYDLGTEPRPLAQKYLAKRGVYIVEGAVTTSWPEPKP